MKVVLSKTLRWDFWIFCPFFLENPHFWTLVFKVCVDFVNFIPKNWNRVQKRGICPDFSIFPAQGFYEPCPKNWTLIFGYLPGDSTIVDNFTFLFLPYFSKK